MSKNLLQISNTYTDIDPAIIKDGSSNSKLGKSLAFKIDDSPNPKIYHCI